MWNVCDAEWCDKKTLICFVQNTRTCFNSFINTIAGLWSVIVDLWSLIFDLKSGVAPWRARAALARWALQLLQRKSILERSKINNVSRTEVVQIKFHDPSLSYQSFGVRNTILLRRRESVKDQEGTKDQRSNTHLDWDRSLWRARTLARTSGRSRSGSGGREWIWRRGLRKGRKDAFIREDW